VQSVLRAGRDRMIEETIKPGDPRLARTRFLTIASNEIAVEAAARRARSLGFNVVPFTGLSREARDAARAFAEQLSRLPTGTCLLGGGETTVRLNANPGRGGRNQEFALSAALALMALDGDWCVLCGGTDGIDGVTDAAGGVIASRSWKDASFRLPDLEPEARRHLARHDSHTFLNAIDGLIITGATGTNVMDVAIGLRI
jgi:glycerate 2-kinase